MMVGCITSTLVVRLLNGCSIYESKLLRQGLNIIRGHDESVLVNVAVIEVMETDFDALKTSDSLKTAADMALNSRFPHFPVLNDNGCLEGILTLRDMRDYFKNPEYLEDLPNTVATVMARTLVSVPKESNLKETLMTFEKTGVSFIPVVDEANRVEGIIKSIDAFKIFREKRHKNRILSMNIKD